MEKYTHTTQVKTMSLITAPDELVRARANKAIDFMKKFSNGCETRYNEELDITSWTRDDKKCRIRVKLIWDSACNFWELRRYEYRTGRETTLSVTDFYDGACILSVDTWRYVQE